MIARRLAMLATTALVAAALATGTGCERKPIQATPATPGADVPGITLAEAGNAGYPTENTDSGELLLRDGQYEDADLVSATLDDVSAAGDLDGDGAEDLAVVLVTSTGGSGVFRDLYVLRRTPAGLQVSAAGALGDRVVVNGMRVERGEVVVDLVVQRDTDPLCCPTLPVSYRFRLAGKELVELSGARRLHLKM